MLPYLFIKQREFEKARDLLKSINELDVGELQMLSELSLLTSPQESLKYAEKAEEEEIKMNNDDDNYTSPFAEAIRKTVKEPVKGYALLFNDDLISYKEIQTELYKKLNQLYPNDPIIQSLKQK